MKIARLRQSAASIIGGLAALAIGLKLSAFIGDARDLGLNDETLYLASGVRWGVPTYPNGGNGLPPADWSPLYALWYRALSMFVHDRVALYYASWTLLVTLGTGALYLLQRRVGVTPTVALVVSFFFATSYVYEVWPYPMHFAVAIVLAGAALAASARDWPRASAVLTATFVLGAFVRPELAIAAILCAVTWLVALVRTRSGALGVGNIALAGALLAIFGNPLAGGRGFYAWGQHYAFGVVRSENLQIDPWFRWYELVTRDFGPVSTIGAALRANPGAFARHVARNAASFPRALVGVTEPVVCAPSSISSPLWALVAVAAFAGVIAAIVRLRRTRAPLPVRVLAFASLAVAVAVGGSIAIVHPRDHYMVPLAALLAVWAGVGISGSRARSRWTTTLAVAVVLVALTPNRAHGWSAQTAAFGTCEPDRRMPVRSTIDTLRSLDVRRHVVGLELAWGYLFYAALDVDRLVEWQKDEPFRSYLRVHDVGVVVISDGFLAHPKFGPDPEYRDFIADPEKWGYRVVGVRDSTNRVAVRHDLEAR